MSVIAIIQARMGSTRLPGKILKEVNGNPLLFYQLERLKGSKLIDEIVIATTTKEQDNEIVTFCEQYGVSYYRGSETDVLSRYFNAAVKFNADTIVRLTSDCPIIDVEVVDKTIQYFLELDHCDYVSNTLERTYPRGLDTEVFTYIALEKAYKEAFLDRDREHVTPYIYTNQDLFEVGFLKNKIDYSNYRLTVDTEEDFELIKLIINALFKRNPNFTLIDIVTLMENNPQWFDINSHIEQKKL